MAGYWLSGALALLLLAGTASAQDLPSGDIQASGNDTHSQGVEKSYDQTRTQSTLYGNGVQAETRQSYRKTHSLSSGNGMLNSETHIRSSATSSVAVPPP